VSVARFVEKLLRRRGMHVVLAGDFDARPESASIRFWRGLQSLGGMSVCYRDAWGSMHPGETGHTFTARNPLMSAENDDWVLELGRRSTTSSCAASSPDRPSTSPRASASSTNPWAASGRATTSASWRILRCRGRARRPTASAGG
jgi:hypothetical protein